jgi:hypothetical protein
MRLLEYVIDRYETQMVVQSEHETELLAYTLTNKVTQISICELESIQ